MRYSRFRGRGLPNIGTVSKKPNATSDAKPPTKSAQPNPPAGEASSPKPRYSRTQVNAAGDALIAPSSSLEVLRSARSAVNNWRAAHSLPLDSVLMELQQRVAAFGEDAVVAARLKRLFSIEAKLRRFRSMQLARMQDVGGCRVVLPSVADVLGIAGRYDSEPSPHAVINSNDYIAEPRASGYRGVHLVSRFRPEGEEQAVYEGMRIEVQLRSRLQHIWATAVETVGTFSGQTLKSSAGDGQWLRLFALMGSEMAFAEDRPLVPGTPKTRQALREELSEVAHGVDAVARLERYRETLRVLEGHVRNGKAEYFHIVVDSMPDDVARVRWNEYAEHEREEAILAFEEVEAAIEHFPGADTVLVRVASIDTLRDAYPSFFADTRVFVDQLKCAIG
ncbi:MAG: RelA/SpoT domain-containing protein [Gammaproteobacteria bacterium]|nr:RelA/SpoT domain-containing protein [Gammaproteobacteria bacterium]